MKRIFLAAVLLLSVTSLASEKWGTQLCRELFTDEPESDSTYSADVTVIGTPLEITKKNMTDASFWQREQIIAYYNYENRENTNWLEVVLDSFDEGRVTYSIIEHMPTHKRYQRIEGYRGDTPVSAIFPEGSLVPIAFTGDGDCYQDQ